MRRAGRVAHAKRALRVLIERDQVIVGMPAVEVRGIVRMFHDWAHSTRGFAEANSVDVAEAGALISRLVDAGLIEPTAVAGPSVIADNETAATAGTLWRTTIAGAALAKARIGKLKGPQTGFTRLTRDDAPGERLAGHYYALRAAGDDSPLVAAMDGALAQWRSLRTYERFEFEWPSPTGRVLTAQAT